MKILWFSLTPSGATEKMTGSPGIGNGWIESMERQLTKRPGVELAVVFPWESEKIERFQSDNVTYFGYPKRKRGKIRSIIDSHLHKTDPDSYLPYYLEIIEEFQPDVIHVFGTEKNFGLVIPHIDIPVLIWIQGNFTVYTQMWFKGFSKKEVWKYSLRKPLLKGYSHWHKYKTALNIAKRERKIFASGKYVIGRTSWDRRITSALAPNAEYFHCDDMLREDFYKNKWTPHGKRDKLILFTTMQDNLYKGLDMIFGCARLLQQSGVSFEWRIAGISERHDLLHIAQRKFGCSAKSLSIYTLGRIPVGPLIERLLHADVYVHTSHIENSPNSVCEAMILGMPVIATNAGGTPDLFDNNREGLLVQPGDIFAMTGAILDLYKNFDKAVAMGEKARVRALKKHDPEKIVNALLDISHKVCDAFI